MSQLRLTNSRTASKRSFLVLLLTILLTPIISLACGVPQPIYGTAPAGSIIELEFFTYTRTTPFGYFFFEPVLPCSSYTVIMRSKHAGTMTVVVEPPDFQGKGVEINF